jgi:hypothetical protein
LLFGFSGRYFRSGLTFLRSLPRRIDHSLDSFARAYFAILATPLLIPDRDKILCPETARQSILHTYFADHEYAASLDQSPTSWCKREPGKKREGHRSASATLVGGLTFRLFDPRSRDSENRF